jgi:hypothetical protein
MKRPFCVYLEFNKKKNFFPYIKLKQSSLAIQEYFSYLEKKYSNEEKGMIIIMFRLFFLSALFGMLLVALSFFNI